MSRVCELTGKGVMVGNNVSHSQRKTRRRYLPNLQEVTFLSNVLKINLNFRVSTNALRTVDKHGGIDQYLINSKESSLSKKARRFKSTIASKMTVAVAA
jgi:large subunit ribosomal protein L28